MAVLYRLYQNNRSNSPKRGEWYGRALMTNVTDTNKLAELIQRNCTAKRSDVLAVLTELVEVMQDELQASHRVKLDGFGSFKIGIKSTSTHTAKEYSPLKNIVGMRVNFTPESKKSADKTRTRTFLTGCTVQEAPKNAVDTKKEESTNENPEP